MKRSIVAPEGFPYIGLGLVLSVLLYTAWRPLLVIGLLLTGFVVFFFRNPARRGPLLPDALLSPADGRVMSVRTVEQSELDGGPAIVVTIFLSLLNVHINRAPLCGKVLERVYRPGLFLPAFKSHASEQNERNTLRIASGDRQVLVHQITGFLARRIVCDVGPGDSVVQRERFGLIRFGSCTELVFASSAAVRVAAGDRVRAGRTIIAEYPKAVRS